MTINWFAVLMYVGVFGSAWLAGKTGRWQWIFGAVATELLGVLFIVLKMKRYI